MESTRAVWQHKGLHRWHNFPDEISALVDRAFTDGRPSAQVLISQRSYTIDFDEGKQRCDDEPAKARSVRRHFPTAGGRNSNGSSSAASAASSSAASAASAASTENPFAAADNGAQPDPGAAQQGARRSGASPAWQFGVSDGSWQDFPEDVAAAIEESYGRGSVKKRYAIRGAEYEIDFRTMRQQSLKDLRRTRAVQRVGGGPAKALDSVSVLWQRFATMAEDVSTEAKVIKFFEQRQQGQATLQVAKCTRVENARTRAFKPEPGNHPTLVFHGTPEANVGNIMAEGLLMQFCGGCGGIFGAPNPNTSMGYAQKAGGAKHGHFMMVCLYDLPAPPPPGTVEVSVPKDSAATVLWLLKLA